MWHFVALTYRPSAGLSYYLNDTNPVSGGTTGLTPDTTTNPCTIGRLGDFLGQYWDGFIDGVSVWDRCLTAREAYSLYLEERNGYLATLPFQRFPVFSLASGNVFAASASASVVLTATASGIKQAVALAASSVVLTSVASESRSTVVVSVASVVLTATASVSRVISASAFASMILTATGAGGTATAVLATASVILLVDASALKAIARDASLRVLLRARARVPGATGPPAGDDYLGRYQQGTSVPLEIQCFQPKGVRALPDRAPVARMYRDGILVGSQVLPVSDDLAARCGGSYLLGPGNEPGLYSVIYWYETGGVPRSQWQVFEVIPGGDMAGPVIAATVLERPDGDQVLAQFGSGVLAVGRDPFIDEGVL